MSRILGVDPGTKRCGVAISDRARTMAFPRPALAVNDALVAVIRAIVEEEGVGLVVVGRPVALSGKETSSTEVADRLFEGLREALAPLAVVQYDERLSTYQAQRSLSDAGIKARDQRSRIDSAAAVVILQNYLDGLHAD
ncbi:MAG: Holliday junction resolvase RuvX [Acidimicrobiales bacterium]